MKKTNLIIIALVVLLIVVTIVASLNVISMWQIKKITYGMTFEAVIDVLGEIKPSNLSGFVKCEWRLANGDTIQIYFDVSEETGESYVTGYFVE